MDDCTAALSSLTYAIKAERILAELGVSARVVKLDASVSRRGCEYGISFDCRDLPYVKTALKSAGISARRYLKGGGEIF